MYYPVLQNICILLSDQKVLKQYLLFWTKRRVPFPKISLLPALFTQTYVTVSKPGFPNRENHSVPVLALNAQ